jgi:hypothetical protein
VWLPRVYLITVPTFRLNSRDYIRAPAPPSKADNARNLTSIRFEPQSETHGSKSDPSTSSLSPDVTRSTASDLEAESKTGHDIGLTFAMPPKPV